MNKINFGNICLKEKIIVFILMIISLVIGYFIVCNASWTWGDDYGFLNSTAVGEINWNYRVAKLLSHGRFFLLGQCDFYFLIFIKGGNSPFAHYVVVLISFFLFVYFSYKLYQTILIDQFKNNKALLWIVFLSLIFLLYYFHRLFFFLVYPERIMVVFLCLFFLFYINFIKTQQKSHAILALLISFFLCYTKETSFIIFATIAGFNLVFAFNKITKLEKVFYFALLANVVIFLILYYFLAYRNTVTFYTRNSTYQEVIYFTLRNIKILFVALLLSFWRFYRFLFFFERDNIIIDAMLFSGILHAIANIILKMPMDYYYFPAVLLILPPILCWSLKTVKTNYILTLLFLITIYYARKFPATINSIQKLRIESGLHLKKLTDYINDSEITYWVQNNNSNHVLNGKMNYQSEILDVYYNFYNKTKSAKKIFKVTELPDSINSKVLILYSDFNLLENRKNAALLKKLKTFGFKKQNLDCIHEIGIYKKDLSI